MPNVKRLRPVPERSLCDTDYNWHEPDRSGAGQSIQVEETEPVFSGLFNARGEPLYPSAERVGFLRFK